MVHGTCPGHLAGAMQEGRTDGGDGTFERQVVEAGEKALGQTPSPDRRGILLDSEEPSVPAPSRS